MFALLVRTAMLAAVVLGVGSAAFLHIAARAGVTDGIFAEHLRARTTRVGLWCAVAVIVTAVARLYLQLDGLRFPDEPIFHSFGPVMTTTTWGAAWIVQVAAAIVGGVARTRAARSRLARTIATLAFCTIGVTLSFSGHAAAFDEYHAQMIAVDALHVLASGVWIGTLAMIVYNWRAFGEGELGRVVNAFSPVAMGCVAVLALSGLTSALMHIPSIADLFNKPYGRTLLIKLAFVGATLAGGFTNWRRNRLRITADGGIALGSGARYELLAAFGALIATAVLINASD